MIETSQSLPSSADIRQRLALLLSQPWELAVQRAKDDTGRLRGATAEIRVSGPNLGRLMDLLFTDGTTGEAGLDRLARFVASEAARGCEAGRLATLAEAQLATWANNCGEVKTS